MALPAFDTHAYVKRLKAAGFNEAQAEAQAELQSEVLSSLVTEKLATKEDIVALEHTMKEDIVASERAMRDNIVSLERAMKEDIAILKGDVTHLEGKFNLLNWMVGFLLFGVVSILFKLFLHA